MHACRNTEKCFPSSIETAAAPSLASSWAKSCAHSDGVPPKETSRYIKIQPQYICLKNARNAVAFKSQALIDHLHRENTRGLQQDY
jgi:hypothetical protein